jgi:hypothetical protein
MDVETITMDPAEARQAFEEYREAVRERHNEEDEALMRGYRELAKGHQLLALTPAMIEAGLDHRGLPRLAICRADAEWCEVYISQDTAVFTMDNSSRWGRAAKGKRVRVEGFPTLTRSSGGPHVFEGTSVVPAIPPPLRPAGKLDRFHVLWEANWKVPPKDPVLLRHMGGDLWAVLAMWNLTELERAVLAGRE